MKADQSLFSGLMTDIRDNVAVGRTVTVHEKMIHYKGWKGSGYIIIDPQTDSGAYLIDGGANGGWLWIGIMILGSIVLLAGIILGAEVYVAATATAYGVIFALTTISAALTLITSSLTAWKNDNGRLCNAYKSFYALTISGALALVIGWFNTLSVKLAVAIEFGGNGVFNLLTNNFLTCPTKVKP